MMCSGKMGVKVVGPAAFRRGSEEGQVEAMIEGINASIASSAVVRPLVDQAESLRSYAANPERVQQVVRAPYVSPYVYVDTTFDKAVLQIRDSDSGDVIRQIPSENQLRAYQKAQVSDAQVVSSYHAERADRTTDRQILEQALSQGEKVGAAEEETKAAETSGPATVSVADPVQVDTTA